MTISVTTSGTNGHNPNGYTHAGGDAPYASATGAALSAVRTAHTHKAVGPSGHAGSSLEASLEAPLGAPLGVSLGASLGASLESTAPMGHALGYLQQPAMVSDGWLLPPTDPSEEVSGAGT
jgi:hypothetical protein